MITVQYTDEYNPLKNGIKLMLYGPWGVGKTPSLATAPLPCIISAEKGLLSLRRTHTPFIEINGYEALKESYLWARDSREAQQYFTLSLDSLSEIAEVLVTDFKARPKMDPRKAFYDAQEEVVKYARAMRDLPGRSVILVAKEEFSKDVNGVQMFQPMMPGNKLGQQLPYFFDEVIRMVQWPGSPQRVFCTKSTYQHQARDRSGMLDEHEPPDFTAMFRKILGV